MSKSATTVTIEVTETPSHSKGWMAYISTAGGDLRYGHQEIPVVIGEKIPIVLIGSINRKTRTQRVREAHPVIATGDPSDVLEIGYAVSASNHYRLTVRGARRA